MSREEDIKQIRKHGFRNFKPERHSYVDEDGQLIITFFTFCH